MNETLTRSGNAVADAEDALQFVGFRLSDELFGVDILMVKEIIKDAQVTAIPDAPEFIKGVINLRGNIIPIIDLRKRLKIPTGRNGSGEEDAWIVILEVNSRVTGFIVDHVTRVIKVPLQSIQPPPEMVSAGLKSDYISGVCKLNDQLLAILDFNRILVVDEFKKISQLKRQGKK